MTHSMQRHLCSSVSEFQPSRPGEGKNVVSLAFSQFGRRRSARPLARVRELEHELVRLRVAARRRRGTSALPAPGQIRDALHLHLMRTAVAPTVSELLPPRLRALFAFADAAASSADHIGESDVDGLMEAGLQLREIAILAKVVATAIYETSFEEPASRLQRDGSS